MQTGKRIWSLVLVAAMICSIFSAIPMTAFAEGDSTEDEINTAPLAANAPDSLAEDAFTEGETEDETEDTPPPGAVISVTSPGSFTCNEGESASFQLAAEGAGNIVFSLGGAPEGVSIGAETGLLAIEETIPAGEYEFEVTASDANGIAAPAALRFALTVEAQPEMGLLRAPAPGTFPDLSFTLAPGSIVSQTKLTGVTNGAGGSNTFRMYSHTVESTSAQNAYVANVGQPVNNERNYEFPLGLYIGSYLNLYEVTKDGLLVNRGSIKVNNSHLRLPATGTTAIAGGEGKVTVSNYQAMTDCKLYLVPASAYPVSGGSIGLAGATEITANGDISCAAGKYTLYTAYTKGIVSPNHGAYAAGAEVTVTAAGTDVCQIGTTGYATLKDAVDAVPLSGIATIKMIANSNETTPIVVENRTITLNLDGFTVNLDTSGTEYSNALSVISGGVLTTTENGAFNITGAYLGINATGGSEAHITGDILATDGGGRGVYATGANTKVTVIGNVTGAYSNSSGVYAFHSSAVEVEGDVSGGTQGVMAATAASVTVTGDVEGTGSSSYGVYVTGENSKTTVTGNVTSGVIGVFATLEAKVEITGDVEGASTGVFLRGDAEVTIVGTITGATYIRIDSTALAAADGVIDPAKPGYLKYTDGTSTVWVRAAAAANVCRIGTTGYPTLADALATIVNDTATTIVLLQDVVAEEILLKGKNVTIDTDGKNLTVNGDIEVVPLVSNPVKYGSLKIIGDVKIAGDDTGIYASNRCVITITGAVVTEGIYVQIKASNNGKIAIEGDVDMYGEAPTIHADKGFVTTGNVTCYDKYCDMSAYNGGSISITGNVLFGGASPYDSYVSVGGDDSMITVTGDITLGNMSSVYAQWGRCRLVVGGSVYGVRHSDMPVVTASHKAAIEIGGDVIATNSDYGAYAYEGGTVTVDGSIKVPDQDSAYVAVDRAYLNINEKNEPSSQTGYTEYTDTDADPQSFIWVGNRTTSPGDLTFTAVQTGGASGAADSTGIVLTFNQMVLGLTADDITITNGTGAAVKGALTGSGRTWTIALSSVTAQGNVTVTIAGFGQFTVETGPQSVAVFKKASAPIILPEPTTLPAPAVSAPADTVPVTGVTLNKTTLSLFSNADPGTERLIATVTPANATNKAVTWRSSDTAVATVDANGNVKAVGNGAATITVTTVDGGYTATCVVTVTAEEDAPDEEPTEIPDPIIPAAGGTWSVVNLVFAGLGIIELIALIIGYIGRRGRKDSTLLKVLSVILSVLPAILFVILERFSGSMVLFSTWSWIIIPVFFASLIVLIIERRNREED